MLDALVAEARERWGLDIGAGLQVVSAERLIATPLSLACQAGNAPITSARPPVFAYGAISEATNNSLTQLRSYHATTSDGVR